LLLTGRLGTAPGATISKIYITPLSHTDVGFTNTPSNVYASYKTTLDNVLSYADSYPSFRYTIECSWQLESWLAQTTDQSAVTRMMNHIRNGKNKASPPQAAGYFQNNAS
jgi:hypothetical protein